MIQGNPNSTCPNAPATIQPAAISVVPACAHHAILRLFTGPLARSSSILATASLRMRVVSDVSTASMISFSVAATTLPRMLD